MVAPLPYCGTPPAPGELLSRFNFDPVLIGALLALAVAHISLACAPRSRGYAALGWLVAAAAFISPLCALSVALFSAGVAQHMILLLVAAPLIASALPAAATNCSTRWLWPAATVFLLALWFWHMPAPYDATFRSTPIYWLMHITLFGSAILLWRELLHHPPDRSLEVLLAGLLTSIHMSLLGAVLTFASTPLYSQHLLATGPWGLTPLHDQQLGGVILWAPGMLLFVWVATRAIRRLWRELETSRAR